MWQVRAVFAAVVFGAFVGTDFVTGNMARPEDERLGFGAYLAGWADRLRGATPAAREGPDLAAFLPPAGNGWTRSAVDGNDVLRMLVPEARDVLGGGGGAPGAEARALAAVGAPRDGVQAAAFTYARGRERVVVELVRHADAVFTDGARAAERSVLEGWVAQQGLAPIGTLNGMQLWQARMSPGLGARMAIAAVGGQVQLRVVHPERLASDDVMALLRGLDVAGLNGVVVVPDPAIAAAVAAAPPAMGHAARDMRPGAPAGDAAPDAAGRAPTVLDVAGKRGGRSDITLGVGRCDSRGSGKFCAVGE